MLESPNSGRALVPLAVLFLSFGGLLVRLCELAAIEPDVVP